MPYLQNATSFLVLAIIGLAIFIVLLRFWMQWVRADFRNELGQFVIRLTNPIVIPLRKVIPSIGTIDTATIVLAYALCALYVFAFFILNYPATPNIIQYLLISLGLLIKYSIYLFLAGIFIQIIASWVNPHSHHPILSIARSISNPIMNPARRVIPPIAGLDLSPMLVILFLQFSLRLLVAPLLLGFPI